MGTGDTYSGGGSIIRIGKDGLEWTSLDPAENRRSHSSPNRPGNRAPTRTEIEQQLQEADRQEAKLIRSFISQCATAYAAEKLDASPPFSLLRLFHSHELAARFVAFGPGGHAAEFRLDLGTFFDGAPTHAPFLVAADRSLLAGSSLLRHPPAFRPKWRRRSRLFASGLHRNLLRTGI